MIGAFVTLIVYLIVLGILYWIITIILGAMVSASGKPLPSFVTPLLLALFGLLALLIILDIFFGIGMNTPVLRFK